MRRGEVNLTHSRLDTRSETWFTNRVARLQIGSAGGIEPAGGKAAPRVRSFGEDYRLTPVDRFGIWLSRRQIERWVPSLAGKVVGDFGCGFHARLARSTLGEVARAYLVDVSLAPDLANHDRVVAIQGALPGALRGVPAGSIDVALCISVLEHLSEPDEMLRELMRVLKP